MLEGLRQLYARREDWHLALQSPLVAEVKKDYTTPLMVQVKVFQENKEWSTDLIGKIALISLKGCIANPLIDLAMMVEGVFRILAGLIVWGISWIPTQWSEDIKAVGEGLLWSGNLGTVEGGSMLVQDVGNIAYGGIKIVQHVWKITHQKEVED